MVPAEDIKQSRSDYRVIWKYFIGPPQGGTPDPGRQR
jgi:hypothetical protein